MGLKIMKLTSDAELKNTMALVKKKVKGIKQLRLDLKANNFSEAQIKMALDPHISFLLGFIEDARLYMKERRKNKLKPNTFASKA
jgi:hypothetical protein